MALIQQSYGGRGETQHAHRQGNNATIVHVAEEVSSFEC